MNGRVIKYLELLSKNFPNVPATAAEIIRLQAILELPKTTEHFMSDIHGEYTYFTHILKNASGAIHSKIDDSFGDLLGEEEKNALALLIYYPERELSSSEHTDSWYRVTIHRLISVCRQATDKYTQAKVRALVPAYVEVITRGGQDNPYGVSIDVVRPLSSIQKAGRVRSRGYGWKATPHWKSPSASVYARRSSSCETTA